MTRGRPPALTSVGAPRSNVHVVAKEGSKKRDVRRSPCVCELGGRVERCLAGSARARARRRLRMHTIAPDGLWLSCPRKLSPNVVRHGCCDMVKKENSA